jgi:hypothetical protein
MRTETKNRAATVLLINESSISSDAIVEDNVTNELEYKYNTLTCGVVSLEETDKRIVQNRKH